MAKIKQDEVSEKDVEVISEAKKAFQEFIEKYKKQNPAKYEIKKAELEKHLASL